MRIFALWLGLVVVVAAGLGGAYHLYRSANPERIAVIVDSSFPMEAVWQQVPGALEEIAGERYAEFSLVTDKDQVHGWQDDLRLGSIAPYAPRNFDRLRDAAAYAVLAEATEVYLITNASAAETAEFADWKIVRLEP
jgi:hypothetical protein